MIRWYNYIFFLLYYAFARGCIDLFNHFSPQDINIAGVALCLVMWLIYKEAVIESDSQ